MGGDRINPPKIAAYTIFRPLEAWSIFLQMTSTTGRDRFEPVNGAYTYGTGPIKSFTAFNLSSSYTFREKSTIRFGVENLFNKDYYTVISQWQSNNMNYVKENGTRLTISFVQAF